MPFPDSAGRPAKLTVDTSGRPVRVLQGIASVKTFKAFASEFREFSHVKDFHDLTFLRPDQGITSGVTRAFQAARLPVTIDELLPS